MKKRWLISNFGVSVLVCSVLLFFPLSSLAQEAPAEKQEQPGTTEKPEGSMSGMGGRGKGSDRMTRMQQRHAEMEKQQQEMLQDLQTQLAAIREHTKVMESITDEKQLVAEMKKHQQMTDALLGTMVEQREQRYARMKEHHEQMRARMEKKHQAGEKKSGCCGGSTSAQEQQSGEAKPEDHTVHP